MSRFHHMPRRYGYIDINQIAPPTPGPTGRNDPHDPSFGELLVSGTKKGKEWKKSFDDTKEWFERIENYKDPDKRQKQAIEDSVKLPSELLEALGFEVGEVFPFTSVLQAEVNWLADFLEAFDESQKEVDQMQADWKKAVQIATEIRPRAEEVLEKALPPEANSYVCKWDAICNAVHRHTAAERGIFAGQGYQPFRYSSFAELKTIALDCRGHILRRAAHVLAAYLFLKVEFAILKIVQASSEKTRGELEDKVSRGDLDSIFVYGALVDGMATRELGQDGAEADPRSYVGTVMGNLERLTEKWVFAANQVSHSKAAFR